VTGAGISLPREDSEASSSVPAIRLFGLGFNAESGLYTIACQLVVRTTPGRWHLVLELTGRDCWLTWI
jgi:hypothetical protein